MNTKLWYRKPAAEWKEGLPVGNGRLAAMVLGYPTRGRLALNHEWLWRGKNRLRDNEDRSGYLNEVRELLLSGNYEEGTRLANDAFGGKGGVSGEKGRVDPYQPAGDLWFELDHGPVADYYRQLDLDTAVVKTAYDAGGVRVLREVLAHFSLGFIMLRISSDNAPISGVFGLERQHDPECKLLHGAEDARMWMDGEFPEGIRFRVEATIRAGDGKVSVVDGKDLEVTDTNEILVFINTGTSSRGEAPSAECSRYPVPALGWDELLRRHVTAYQNLYGRLRLELPLDGREDMPTDERIKAFREGRDDPGLPLLYFNYGRYLLCSSSASAELPANLQGKWNEDLNPPWECDYHHDINLQMNYWIAEPGHLQECTAALLHHLERLVPHARKAARDLYGCDGIWIPITTDAWCRATPEAYGWAVWIGAAAWLAQHMWWHYEYGQDTDFLRERAYPFLKEVAAFYESYLIEDENGTLQILPSQSPENRFAGAGDLPVSISVSSAMDIQLAAGALSHAIKAGELLGVDPEKRERWTEMLKRLPSLKIGSHGQLLEWNEEFEEIEPGHRHMSHLVGLYPGEQISRERTPELFEAARVSVERRLAAGGGHTGWSRAWTACFFARLGEGDRAFEHLRALIGDFATDSLLDLHPPRIFQIDGNLGGAAAVLEMLLQSYHGELHFLPAVPSAWPEGKVTGLRARGGYTVNMEWKNRQLIRAGVVSLKDRTCTIKQYDRLYEIRDAGGNPVECQQDGVYIRFEMKSGRPYYVSEKQ